MEPPSRRSNLFLPLFLPLFFNIFSFSSLVSSRPVPSCLIASLCFPRPVRNPINDRPPHALARAVFFASSGLSPFHCIPPTCPPGSLPPRRVVPYRISVHLRAIGSQLIAINHSSLPPSFARLGFDNTPSRLRCDVINRFCLRLLII